MIGEWSILIMSNHWVRYMSKAKHYNKGMTKSALARACIKVSVNPMPEGKSWNHASFWIHSKCPRTGAELNLGCEPYKYMNSKWFCTDVQLMPPSTKIKG